MNNYHHIDSDSFKFKAFSNVCLDIKHGNDFKISNLTQRQD